MNTESPGGSMFPYYYKGGELYCLKYGSFFADEDSLIALMKAEEDFISRRNQQLRIWVDFYETQLTNRVAVEFMESICRLRHHIVKLALVGCSARDRWRLKRLIKKTEQLRSVPLKFFSDPEEAKTWLVSSPH